LVARTRRAGFAARRPNPPHPSRRGDLHCWASKKESALLEWLAAIEALMLVADRGGPTMFARIGVMRALNRHVERVFDPSRKEKHWGQRKLARDR